MAMAVRAVHVPAGHSKELLAVTAMARHVAQSLVPRYSFDAHKGSHGRTAILGGSFEYTGAPYYAAMSSLKAGGDLAYVLCTPEAAVPIKAYSPELIVLPLLPHSRTTGNSSTSLPLPLPTSLAPILDVLSRVHAVVIGPGLGRDNVTVDVVQAVIEQMVAKDVPLVLDGDALWAVSSRPALRAIVAGARNIILTPNAVEYQRLLQAAQGDGAGEKEKEGKGGKEGSTGATGKPDALQASIDGTARLSHALQGVAIVAKGRWDVVAVGAGQAGKAEEGQGEVAADGRSAVSSSSIATAVAGVGIGSPRRCGGQGDVLAGLLGVFLSWAKASGAWADTASGNGGGGRAVPAHMGSLWSNCTAPSSSPSSSSSTSASTSALTRPQLLLGAAYGASSYTRIAAGLAFDAQRRSTTTPDIIAMIGRAVEQGCSPSDYASMPPPGTGDTPSAAASALPDSTGSGDVSTTPQPDNGQHTLEEQLALGMPAMPVSL